MDANDEEPVELIERAAQGDAAATQQLLTKYRGRLRQMVAVRLDRRLAARFDPSDVVQEAFVEIVQRLPEYLRTRPMPLYPWLRHITWEQLTHLHTRHLGARKRTPLREEQLGGGLSDASVMLLARRVAAVQSSPSRHAIRNEEQARVRLALEQLESGDRELLILKYLEQLRTREIATVLQIGEGAVRMRHLRALERLRELLGGEREDTS